MARGVSGRINIDLVARTAGFKEGMKKARVQMRRMRSEAKLLKRVFAGIGIGLVARQLVNFVRTQARAVDALAKTADRLGTTTEALAGMQHAAQLTGVATRTLEMGLQRMTRRVAEAAQGTGEAKAAIKELGLDAQVLAELPLDKAFGRVASAMNKVKSNSDQVRLSFKLFDSEGVALLNTLRLGEKALADMQKRAKALGLAVTRDDARAVEAMNDAVTEMVAGFQGIGRTIAVSIAPHVKALADWLQKAAKFANEITALGGTAPATSALDAMMQDYEARRAKILSESHQFNRAWSNQQLKDLEDWKKRFIDANRALLAGVARPGQAAPGLPAVADEGGAPSLGATQKEAIQKSYDALVKSLDTEREAIFRSYDERRQIIVASRVLADVDQAKMDALELRANDEKQRKLTALTQKGADARKQIQEWESQLKVQAVQNWASALVRLTSIDAQTSKAAFDRHKLAASAEVGINAAAGIMRGFKDLPPWAAWANAAAVGASGIAQIAAIQASSFSGGGTIATPAGPTAGETAVAAGGGATPQTVRVSLEGSDIFSGDSIRRLIDKLAETHKDGYILVLD